MINLNSFPKIDAHFHSTSYDPFYEKTVQDYNLHYININTNASVFPQMDKQTALVDDWNFLSTYKSCKSAEVPGTFKGFGLPEEILHQLYFDNAKRIYSRLKF